MKFSVTIACFTILTTVSCKKEYTCECSNAYSTYDAGTVEKTKGQANRYCKNLSAGETTCKVK